MPAHDKAVVLRTTAALSETDLNAPAKAIADDQVSPQQEIYLIRSAINCKRRVGQSIYQMRTECAMYSTSYDMLGYRTALNFSCAIAAAFNWAAIIREIEGRWDSGNPVTVAAV